MGSGALLTTLVVGLAWAAQPGASAEPSRARPTLRLLDERSAAPLPVDAALATHAAAAAHEAAVEQLLAVAATALPPPHTGVDWDAIARCETGGNWHMQGSRFSGGVGFANTTWTGFGGREFAPNAGQATREEQIVVAERVYARYGLSGWGCKRFG